MDSNGRFFFLTGPHELINSLSFENLAKGIDSIAEQILSSIAVQVLITVHIMWLFIPLQQETQTTMLLVSYLSEQRILR